MHVHIRIADRGWILERMAAELAKRLRYASFDTETSSFADIQYYLTYSSYKSRISPVEIAYFTHLEEDSKAKATFFNVADKVDYCVCMSRIYADILTGGSNRDVRIIGPGVDLDLFRPALKIGVVGRTYSTGRKGEALLSEVVNIPGIEWHFTGEGWPGTALNLPPEELPAFYRSMDYILVPARYEGGPMSAIEALACGVEVIGPEIGWLPELPHITYRNGDASHLRTILAGLLEKRFALSRAVADRTWENFAEKHDQLFHEIAGRHGLQTTSITAVATAGLSPNAPRVALLTHGAEGKAQGGPSTRIPQLAAGLAQHNFNAEFGTASDLNIAEADLVHIFNVAMPQSAIEVFEIAKSLGKPTVFSPIYLDNRCRRLWLKDVPAAFTNHAEEPSELERALRLIAIEADDMRQRPVNCEPEFHPGYHAMLAKLIEDADELILLSNRERQLIESAIGRPVSANLVRNPVDIQKFASATGDLFESTYGIRDYVLCVGRIEPRKNQLVLAHALRALDVPVVLVGHCLDSNYQEMVRSAGGPNVHFVGRLAGQSEMLASAYAGAKCFILPSWSEGAPLSALEAASSGAKLILSSFSGEDEYFGSFADYIHPLDVDGMREAVARAYRTERDSNEVRRQIEFIASSFSVAQHVSDTAKIHHKLVSRSRTAQANPVAASLGTSAKKVYLDVTTVLNNNGKITGITRVELMLLDEIKNDPSVICIAWHRLGRHFFYVPGDLLSFVAGPTYAQRDNLERVTTLPKHSKILIQGNAWLQNKNYVEDVTLLIRNSAVSATLLIHDILPISHAQYFPPDQSRIFEECLQRMQECVQTIAADSMATKAELEKYFRAKHGKSPAISVVRLGDGLASGGDEAGPKQKPDVAEAIDDILRSGSFVLSVGSLSPHKNRYLLYQVWARLVADLGHRAPQLIIVGGAGSNQQLLDLVTRDRLTGSKIRVLTGIEDTALDLLYRNCLFTVFPSLCEGWGLPVSESLVHGKICIASACSSMVEIAPAVTDLIDPLDVKAWYSRIRSYVVSSGLRKQREAVIREKFVPHPWRSTARQLLDLAIQSADAEFSLRAYFTGQVIDLRDNRQLYAYSLPQMPRFLKGDSWGAWTEEAEVAIGFKLFHTNAGPRTFAGLYRMESKGAVQVLLNGHLAATWHFGNGEVKRGEIGLPESVGDSQEVVVQFLILREEDGNTKRKFWMSLFAVVEANWSEQKRTTILDAMSIPSVLLGKFDDTVMFGSKGNGNYYLRDGWHAPEAQRVWSSGTCSLSIPLHPSVSVPFDVLLQVGVLQPQTVVFEIAGSPVGTIDFTGHEKMREVRLAVSSDQVRAIDFVLELTVKPSKSCSPLSLGMSGDARILGITLISLRLERTKSIAIGGRRKRPTRKAFKRILKKNVPKRQAVGANVPHCLVARSRVSV